MQLRSQQERIVQNYRGGYMAVPAVPGAGKTTTLAHLASELIDEGNILIVTYMNSAVGNFKSKIQELLKEKDKNPQKGYEVRTLHSLAMNILAERPELMGLGAEAEPIDEQRQRQVLNRIVDQWIQAHRDEWEKAIDKNIRERKSSDRSRIMAESHWRDRTKELAAEMITSFKMSGLSPQWLEDKTENSKKALRWFAEIYGLYQRELINSGLLDFNDMILYARDLLKSDRELLEQFRSHWEFIFEDEAQDSNPVQEEILFLLAGRGLVRVGDSNQAIMGTFTNSDPSLFRNYCRREDVEVMPLSVSGRSAGQIIELANHLVDWSLQDEFSEALEDLKIEPVPPGEPGQNPQAGEYLIDFYTCETSEDEYEILAEQASQYTLNNPDKTAGILVPKGFMARPVVEKLEQRGIPCREVTNKPLKREQFLDAILAVLSYLARPHKNNLFLKSLKSLLPAVKDHPALENFFWEVNLEELLYPVEEETVPAYIKDIELWPEVSNWLEEYKYWISCVHYPVDDLILIIAGRLGLDSEQLAVADKMAFQARITQQANPGWRLVEIADEMPFQINSFVSFSHHIAGRNGFEPEKGEVNVITYHKAKGMEWDAVFLAALTNRNFPGTYQDRLKSELWFLPDSSKNPFALVKAQLQTLLGEKETDAMKKAKKEEIMERRRLVYVAVTRAREKLFLSSHKKEITPWRKYDTGPCEPLKALMKFIEERREARC